jgi:hypothetical protein
MRTLDLSLPTSRLILGTQPSMREHRTPMPDRASVFSTSRLFALATGSLLAATVAAQVAPRPAAAAFIDRDPAARVFFRALETEARAGSPMARLGRRGVA